MTLNANIYELDRPQVYLVFEALKH
ncbi:hypothetical protein MED297_04679 [Reinekea sp. MED297]|uniref:Uncharacterized protein n=1 Tax=Reinekea blandensis MED297 TaxID=314283 RepID=A4BK01_9GAMM|nr:hypothetical protein MED297_04679 [Reinekea sp. MED297] [Reinekea blandensis MED297]